MTKNEMVDKLIDLGATESKTQLKKKTNEELEKMISEFGIAEDVEEAVETVETDVVSEVGVETLTESTYQLGVFVPFTYQVRNADATVVIENLGFGDLYFSEKPLNDIGKSEKLITGESKTFKGDYLHLISASQPQFKVTEKK